MSFGTADVDTISARGKGKAAAVRKSENDISWKASDVIPYGINSIEELKDFKEMLKTSVGQTFNTNVMRIALNMQEERLASLLIAYYSVKVDEEMVLRAIKTAQLDFL